VGDATMSPYEIIYPGGSVEHWNEEPGSLWMQRLLDHYANAIWLNPEPETRWQYTPSTGLLRDLMEQRMFPLTVNGLERGMKDLM
ncbi:MAG: VWA domain-containing protein, partial [Gammaproteobacteria bacterium]